MIKRMEGLSFHEIARDFIDRCIRNTYFEVQSAIYNDDSVEVSFTSHDGAYFYEVTLILEDGDLAIETPDDSENLWADHTGLFTYLWADLASRQLKPY